MKFAKNSGAKQAARATVDIKKIYFTILTFISSCLCFRLDSHTNLVAWTFRYWIFPMNCHRSRFMASGLHPTILMSSDNVAFTAPINYVQQQQQLKKYNQSRTEC